MAPVSQRLPDFLGGVSRQSPDRRSRTEVMEALNAYPHPVRGLMKRPPVVHRGLLSPLTEPYVDSGIYEINKDLTDRYWLSITNGDLKVFNANTGAEFPVTFPQGKAYLQGPGSAYRTVTFGDTTVIVNPNRVVRRSTAAAPERKTEALVFIRHTDFSTSFRLTLNGRTVEYITPDGTTPHAKAEIETEKVMARIHGQIVGLGIPGFEFRRIGSTLHIFRTDGGDFTVATQDGMGDDAFITVKDRVQRFEDLPVKGVTGFTVEVTGDPGTEYDNFWVQYADGSWREVAQPGSTLGLDPTTMPHQLTLTGAFTGRYEVLRGEAGGAPRISGLSEHVKTGTGFDVVTHRKVSRLTGQPPAAAETRLSFAAVTETHYPAGSTFNLSFEGRNAGFAVPANTPAPGLDVLSVMQALFSALSGIVGPNHTGQADGIMDYVIRPIDLAAPAAPLGFSSSIADTGSNLPTITTLPPVIGDGGGADGTSPRIVLPTDDALLAAHEDLLSTVIATPAITNPAVHFDVDTTGVPPGWEVILQLKSGETILDQRRYPPGVLRPNQVLEGVGLHGDLGVLLLYSPGEDTFRASAVQMLTRVVTVWGTGRSIGGITQATPVGTVVDLPEMSHYPEGSSVTVGVTNVVAPAPGYTAEEMTDALLAAIAGSVRLSPTSFSVPVPGLAGSATGVAGGFVLFRDAKFEPGEHAGRILENLTDGSTWAITGNTEDTITLGDMLSGSSDGFDFGDLAVVRGDGSAFVFKPMDWTPRKAGGMLINPLPSFVDHTISDAFYYQGRLGFTSEDRVVCSVANDLLNFFRHSAQNLIDSDPIDIQSTTKAMSHFHSAVEWSGGLYLISEYGPFRLSGDPVLAPDTARLEAVGHFPNTGKARPSVSGATMVLGRGISGHAQVHRLTLTQDRGMVGEDTTERVAGYVEGTPSHIVTDEALGVTALITDAAPRNRLWVLVSREGADGIARLNAWCRWELTAGSTIVGIEILDGKLGLVTVRPGVGTTLETIDLRPVFNPATEATAYLDRGTEAYPYQVDLHKLFFVDDRTGEPQPSGTLKVTWVELEVHETSGLTATVELPGRAPRVRTYTWDTPFTGSVRFPVQGDARTANISITNATPGGSILSSMGWEGHYSVRHRRFQ